MSVFAKIYDLMMYRLEKLSLADCRSNLLELTYGRILEIGTGTGANLDKFKEGVNITLTDPDNVMLKLLEKKMSSLGINGKVKRAASENLPFTDNSFDTVVSTLVLCSVKDLEKSIKEIKRVLVPGGKLLFIEHVRDKNLRAWFQDKFCPAWSWFAEGCRLNSMTMDGLKDSGFTIIKAEHFNPAEKIWLINSWPVHFFLPFINGFAINNKK